MNTLYEKAVELLVSDIQDKALKEKIGTLLAKRQKWKSTSLQKTSSYIQANTSMMV